MNEIIINDKPLSVLESKIIDASCIADAIGTIAAISEHSASEEAMQNVRCGIIALSDKLSADLEKLAEEVYAL